MLLFCLFVFVCLFVFGLFFYVSFSVFFFSASQEYKLGIQMKMFDFSRLAIFKKLTALYLVSKIRQVGFLFRIQRV